METFGVVGSALLTLLDPWRFAILCCGVAVGLVIGIIPGLGGIVGLSMLIPFTYALDPYAAMALLIGMAAVTATSDVIPAVLFGVPGTVGCAATVVDGYPLARKGQAGRALGACYAASLLGGLFGALLLGVSLPVLRPVVLYMGSPELLAIIVFGISMVAVLSGNAPLRGMAAAGLGLMIAFIGAGPQTGTLRWTFGQLYLWEGLPIVPLTIGLFALPELADLMIRRSRIAQSGDQQRYSLRGQRQGMADVMRHWWLVLRCGWLGAALGAIPGIGSSVIDWMAYGHALRTEKNTETFGKGDIRGVIASEASNNAKEGGALVPTIAFGVPGSASMALLLGAFMMHGLVPGPEMLGRNLDVTYSIIWSLAIANIIGAAICVLASGQLARVAYIRFSVLLPVVLSIAFIGAFQATSAWGDLYMLLLFGVLGFLMKHLNWPRPPLILGFVLGDIFERYLFISVERYGTDWILRPIVLLMFALALLGLIRPMRQLAVDLYDNFTTREPRRLNLGVGTWFNIAFIAVVAGALWISLGWPFDAAIVPQTVGIVTLIFATFNLAATIMRPAEMALKPQAVGAALSPGSAAEPPPEEEEVDWRTLYGRGAIYFLWLVGLLVGSLVFGLIPAIFLFVVAFMRIEGRERWTLSLQVAFGLALSCWLLFDRVLAQRWPAALLGDLLPWLRQATGLM